MCPSQRDDDPGPTAVSELTDTLRAGILDGDPAPGTPLREEELSRRFGMSRHTVRAALARLSDERLLEFVPYRGARVATLDDEALVALQQLRGALESEAIHLLREAHGDAWPSEVIAPIGRRLDELAAAESAGDWQRVTRAHSAVHLELVAAAGSSRITEAYARLDSEILVLLLHLRPDYGPGALDVEHRAYVESVQRNGSQAVRAHLNHSTDLIRSARAHSSSNREGSPAPTRTTSG